MLAELVQGVFQELKRNGPHRRPAAKLILDSLLATVAASFSPGEENAQLQQAYHEAVQVRYQVLGRCKKMIILRPALCKAWALSCIA